MEADELLQQHALVKLTHGSVLNWEDFTGLDREIKALEAERDRARALAAKLEEVVAMRTAIVKAVAERNPDERPDQMIAVQAWARAQLQEIP